MSRGGYYAWRNRAPSARTRSDERLLRRIRTVFEASEGTYGSPRIHAALQAAGTHVGRKRVARLMGERGLRARSARIYRRTPGTRRFFGAVPNRILDLTITACDQVWVGDLTYLKVAGTPRYLAAVMDAHSRRILGWRLGPHRDLPLTLGALDRAVLRRRVPDGLIFHSDRGAEYAAYRYRARLAALGITQSMKRPRELGDNALIESFFHTFKSDVIHGATFATDIELLSVVKTYIRRYNRTRLHSSLGYRSPIDFERSTA